MVLFSRVFRTRDECWSGADLERVVCSCAGMAPLVCVGCNTTHTQAVTLLHVALQHPSAAAPCRHWHWQVHHLRRGWQSASSRPSSPAVGGREQAVSSRWPRRSSSTVARAHASVITHPKSRPASKGSCKWQHTGVMAHTHKRQWQPCSIALTAKVAAKMVAPPAAAPHCGRSPTCATHLHAEHVADSNVRLLHSTPSTTKPQRADDT